ncbi:enoyl-CoA hydratase-related protein [Brevibacterium sp.]|uniref:enoyl-CoA hydratase-related protein n=1 Tax=Brevibacterium sp. TaxID=1701 RepID=UPI002811C411|nr:enoyl-CoA hydratase-related protein [Brevibacterium sp.]
MHETVDRSLDTRSQDYFTTHVGSSLWVTFNRPESLNALTSDMYEGIRQACRRAESDPTVTSLVFGGVDGSRRSFAAGSDITAVADILDWETYRDYEDGISEIISAIQNLSIPTVAAIAGPCVGAGATLALACDLRVVADSVKLGYPMARTTGGTLPPATYVLLASQVGIPRALDMLLSSRLIRAQEIVAAGLAAEVVPEVELDEATKKLTERISTSAPLSLKASKTEIRRLRERLAEGAVDDVRQSVFESADYREGLTAFLEHRPPVWTGR